MAHRSTGLALLALLAGSMSIPASAATIWDEATDGDISGYGVPPPTFNFGYGVNTIKGQDFFFYSPDDNSGTDEDIFAFLLPEKGRLQGITVRISNVQGPQSVLNLGYQLYKWDPLGIYPELELSVWVAYYLDPSIVDNPLRLSGLTLTHPAYIWFDSGMTGNYGVQWDYEYDFLVTAAPEPGSLALLVFGLGAMAVGRRSRTPSGIIASTSKGG